MSCLKWAFLGMLVPCLAGWSWAAPPPANDRFPNRTVLTGDDISFTASVAGATIEYPGSGPFEVGSWLISFPSGGSLWWSWTATSAQPVTVFVRRLVPRAFSGWRDEVVNVYLPPELDTFPTNLCNCFVASRALDPPDAETDFTFQPIVGATYQLQLIGVSTNEYQIRWLATNRPVILQQPSSQVLSPGEATVLTVIPTGLRPFRYQWQRNGTDLVGETCSMLMVTNVTAADAGSYRVAVSNVTGQVLSDEATLTVRSDETAPRLILTSLGAQRLGFQLCGEVGRCYGIETSTNLTNWAPAKNFPDTNRAFFSNSVVRVEQDCVDLTIPAGSSKLFVRAGRHVPTNSVCEAQLQQLRHAKVMWKRDFVKVSSDTPSRQDVEAYYAKPIRGCPAGGSYVLEQLYREPWCLLSNHVVERPR